MSRAIVFESQLNGYFSQLLPISNDWFRVLLIALRRDIAVVPIKANSTHHLIFQWLHCWTNASQRLYVSIVSTQAVARLSECQHAL